MDGSQVGGPPGANGRNGTMSRAEQFEDEKRRIIESCFSKKDIDGSVQESYITHIRIIEDGSYQSSPPPPNSPPEAKKPRLIIVAVRKSGRVRMHKARENANGTFSIGKTWPLDDLSAVESYNGSRPRNPEEEQRKQWAGGQGFTVSIGKPYYWQANTQKEKQFFIASLVKIYTKYTGGNSPELIGFDEKEKEQLLGIKPPQPRPAPPSATLSQSSMQSGPAPPFPGNGYPGRQPALRSSPSREPISRREQNREPLQQEQSPHHLAHSHSSQNLRAQPSQFRGGPPPPTNPDFERATALETPPILRTGNGNRSQESFGNGYDNTNKPPRSRGGTGGLPSAPGRFPDRSGTPTSQRSTTPDSHIGRNKDSVDDIPPVPAPLTLPPERRRPPMPQLADSSNDSMIPAPLATPSLQREFMRPPARSSERPEPVQPLKVSSPVVQEQPTRPSLGGSQETSQSSIKFATGSIQKETSNDLPKAASVVVPPIPAEPVNSPISEEENRPGLGPMIKKKSRTEVANAFRKAAASANAFKPRAGGAAERLREQVNKSPEGPDGITGVVPAPSLLRGLSIDSTKTSTSIQTPVEKTEAPPVKAAPEVKDAVPEVKITRANDQSPEGAAKQSSPEKKDRDVKRQKPTSELTQKQLTSLGVDPSLLDGRGTDFVHLLDDFGWTEDGVHTKNIDQMHEEIERELNKAQVGGWLTRLEEEDERVEAIKKGLNICIGECDEFDVLLTLYGVELGTLNEDIAYIEAQSQGLQVQAANQKLLLLELQALLDTISISSTQLQSLKESSLESSRGLEQIETSLVMLFKAMVTIDPTLSLSAPRSSEDGNDSLRSGKVGRYENSEIGSMRVLQEKKDIYRTECIQFLRRLKPFLQVKFGAAIDEARKALERGKETNLSKRTGKTKLDPRNHDMARTVLWKYSPLMLFSREVDRFEWEDFMKTYETTYKPVYQEEIRDAVAAWQRLGRKSTGDEHEILFTSQMEKQAEGLATTARKLTVKRSQTLAKSLRSPLGDNSSRSTVDKVQDGRLHRFEVISSVLDETTPLITMEQNFMVDFFHISSLETQDFPEVVLAAPPDLRRGGDLRKLKLMDPNRDLAKRVVQSMEDLYSFMPGDLQNLVDWAIKDDPLQGVGVLAAMERKMVEMEESNQEFLARTLHKLHASLSGLFTKFLDEQIRAIEDTKVKIKKRKGVISFVRIFPSFSTVLENMLASADDLDIRETVNNAYHRINKTMFESLKAIAREDLAAIGTGNVVQHLEEKEALNYHILLIENMNHYVEEVDTRRNPVLEEWKEKAAHEFEEHLDLYLASVMLRPLGRLITFLDTVETSMAGLPAGTPPSTVAQNSRHSKVAFQQILAEHDSKHIRTGISALKKRVEKHFGDADDPGLSRGLVAKVLGACEKYYDTTEARIDRLGADVYGGDVAVEWTRQDVSASFGK